MTKLLRDATHTWPAATSDVINSSPEDRFEVVCSDARKFLSECMDQSYDIVIAAGVLHCFHDPINVLAEMSRVAKEFVMIESIHPAATRTGALQDYTGAFEPMNHMEFSPSAQVNVAKEFASITGVAAVPTKALLENAMHAAGFETFTIQLAEHPTHNREIAQYTVKRRFHATPLRFFLRCIRRSNTARNTFQLLENVVKEDEDERTCHKSPWMGNLESWNRFQNDTNYPNPVDCLGQNMDVVAQQGDSSPNFLQQLSAAWIPFQAPGQARPSAFREENVKDATLSPTTEDRVMSKSSEMSSPEQFRTWESVETLAHKIQFDASRDPYPYFVSAWGTSSEVPDAHVDSCKIATFGFVYSGKAELTRDIEGTTLTTTLVGGMYFSCPGKFYIQGGSGFIVTVKNEELPNRKKCSFTIGGPIEKNETGEHIGNLPYIDGCSDSILIHPMLYGYPCLNHLHFPKNVQQTRHTHPSGRAGMVFQGEGTCVIVNHKRQHEILRVPLRPGMVFVIPKDAEHAFETNGSQTFDVIAFHPDSDYGPTNTNHPMVNRTIVDGIPASTLPSIQTKL